MENKSLIERAREKKEAVDAAALQRERDAEWRRAEHQRRVQVSRERAMEFVSIMESSGIEPSELRHYYTRLDETAAKKERPSSFEQVIGRGWVVLSQYVDQDGGWKLHDDSHHGIIVLNDGRSYEFYGEDGPAVFIADRNHPKWSSNHSQVSAMTPEELEGIELYRFAGEDGYDLLSAALLRYKLVS